MKKKQKPRYVVADGPYSGVIRQKLKVIHDTSVKPPKPVRGKLYANEYEAERVCRRMNMMNDPVRAEDANSLIGLIGPKKQLFTFSYGWNRRIGCAQAVACFLADGHAVRNVSAKVATVLDLKWNDDDSVAYGRSGDLVRTLSYMLYGNERRLINMAP